VVFCEGGVGGERGRGRGGFVVVLGRGEERLRGGGTGFGGHCCSGGVKLKLLSRGRFVSGRKRDSSSSSYKMDLSSAREIARGGISKASCVVKLL
jgi:hypothetical protein